MPSILYIIPYLSIGGTEKHLLDLVRGFSDQYELFLLAPPGETLNWFQGEKIAYYPFPRLEQRPVSGLKTFFRHLKEILSGRKIDLIHIHAAPELVMLTRMVAGKIPVVLTVHGFHGPFKALDYWVCARLSNLFATRVVTVATAEEEILLKKGIRKSLIQTIHNGVPDPRQMTLTRPEIFNSFAPGKTVIGVIARLETTKGVNYLLQALATLIPEFPDLQLVIVGTGSKEKELRELTTKLGLDSLVIFAGYQQRVHDYLHRFEALVIPSLHEAHPLVLLEALGHGKPVIATTVGGIPEVIMDGENGLLVPPADSPALATALRRLLKEPRLRERLGANARATYEERFAASRMVAETDRVYQTLMSS